jgi:hypothetical protein
VQAEPLQITTAASLPNATNGQSYGTTLMSTGGQGSITWTVTPGSSLPTGFVLDSSGQLSSTSSSLTAPPYAAYALNITATDSVGTTAQKQFMLNVQLSSGFCPSPNSSITNVLLPPVTVQSSSWAGSAVSGAAKGYQISYESIGLNFLTDVSNNALVACEAQASATLPVVFNFLISGLGVTLFVTVQVVEAVFSNDGADWALRCDRIAALR